MLPLTPPQVQAIAIIIRVCFCMGLFVGLLVKSWAWNILALICGVIMTVGVAVVILLLLVPAKDQPVPGGLIALTLLIYGDAGVAAFVGHWLGTLIVRFFLWGYNSKSNG